jgi:hypothetical protein
MIKKRRHTSLKTNVVSSEDCSIGEMVELLARPWVHRIPKDDAQLGGSIWMETWRGNARFLKKINS